VGCNVGDSVGDSAGTQRMSNGFALIYIP